MVADGDAAIVADGEAIGPVVGDGEGTMDAEGVASPSTRSPLLST